MPSLATVADLSAVSKPETVTLAPTSTVPLSVIPASASDLLTILPARAKSLNVGATTAVSVVMVVVPAALVLPAASVCVALRAVAEFASKSAETMAMLQDPSDATVAVLSATPDAKPVTVTVAPASPVPVRLNPADSSAAFKRSSDDTASKPGALGACRSVVTVSVAALLTLPAPSVCVALSALAASAANSPDATATLQVPSDATVAVLSATPDAKPVTVTVAPASPVPLNVIVPEFSDALTRLSVDTALIVGAATVTSVVKVRVAAAETLPAASDCVALNTLAASSVKSPDAIDTDQSPLTSTVAVLSDVLKPVTVTVAPASPVPDRVIPLEISAAFTRSSVETAAMVGALGALRSVDSVSVPAALALPATST